MSTDRDEEKRKIDAAMKAMPQWKRDILAQEFGPPKTIRVSTPGVDFSEFAKAQGSPWDGEWDELLKGVKPDKDAWINGKWDLNLWTRFGIFFWEMIVHALRATIIVIFGAAIAVMGLLFVTEIVVTMPHWLPVLLWTLRAGCLLMLVLIGYTLGKAQ